MLCGWRRYVDSDINCRLPFAQWVDPAVDGEVSFVVGIEAAGWEGGHSHLHGHKADMSAAELWRVHDCLALSQAITSLCSSASGCLARRRGTPSWRVSLTSSSSGARLLPASVHTLRVPLNGEGPCHLELWPLACICASMRRRLSEHGMPSGGVSVRPAQHGGLQHRQLAERRQCACAPRRFLADRRWVDSATYEPHPLRTTGPVVFSMAVEEFLADRCARIRRAAWHARQPSGGVRRLPQSQEHGPRKLAVPVLQAHAAPA